MSLPPLVDVIGSGIDRLLTLALHGDADDRRRAD
jgi:hypothetical protein